MSGGSYNYLCGADDLEDLLAKGRDLNAMAVTLARLGYADDAAQETQALISDIRAVEVRARVALDRLGGVFKAVEWWRSRDWSEDRVQEALTTYRSRTGGVQKGDGE